MAVPPRKVLVMEPKSLELKEKITANLKVELESIVNLAVNDQQELDFNRILREFILLVPFDPDSQKKLQLQMENKRQPDKVIEFLQQVITTVYDSREKQLGVEMMRQIERFVTLITIDRLWMDHLDALDNLREGIGLRGYGQKDPLVEYKKEAFDMFESLVNSIDDEINRRIFRVQPTNQPATVVPQAMETNIDEADGIGLKPKNNLTNQAPSSSITRSAKPAMVNRDPKTGKKIGRNDPCYCGSGKKFKKCHGR